MSSFRRCTSGKADGGNNRVMPRRVTLAIVLAALAPASAAAEETGSLPPYGRHLAQECTACHGADAGQGKESGIPGLAGRPAAELTDLLHAFREERRTNPVMVSVAKSLDEQQIAALAAYFASLSKAPDGAARAP
jgi:cytochrome c553